MPHPMSANHSSSLTNVFGEDSGPDEHRKRPKTAVTRVTRTEYQSKICKSAERRKRGDTQHAWAQGMQVNRPLEPQKTRVTSPDRPDSGLNGLNGLNGLVNIPSFKPFVENA